MTKAEQLKIDRLEAIYKEAKKKRIVLNRDEFADKLKYSRSHVYKMSQGEYEITEETMELAEAVLRESKHVSHETLQLNNTGSTYLQHRNAKKINSGPVMVPLVTVKAQAGYSKAYDNTDFLEKLDLYPIVPGIDPHGAIWRYFQIDGDSMCDTFNDGDYILSSQVPRDDWPDLKDFLVYVIVTDAKVLIKRVAKRKGGKEWVLISDNEKHEQFTVNPDDVKELWKYRRHIGWNAAAPKKVEIKI